MLYMCPICVYKLVLLNASSYQLPEMLVLEQHHSTMHFVRHLSTQETLHLTT